MSTPTLPGSPALRELLRDMRDDLALEQSSSSHFRVVVKETGEPVRAANGRPITVPSTPRTSGKSFENMKQNLIKEGVLVDQNGTSPKKTRRKPAKLTDEQIQIRWEKMMATKEGAERVTATGHLRDRLEPLLNKAGGLDRVKPGDMARIASRAYMLRTGEPWPLDSALTTVSFFHAGRALSPGEIERLEKLADHLESVPDARLEWFGMLREVLGLEAEIQPGRSWPYQVKPIPLDKLHADYDYQRPIQEAFVRDMVLRFDERLVGVLNVSERPDGTYAIIDGLQRKTAMERVGKTAAFCCIHPDLTQAQEAALFFHHNRDRKPVHPFYDFRARIVAGDPIATEIDRIVKQSGFVIDVRSQGKTPGERERHIAAIRSLEEVYGYYTEVRDECLTPTLSVIFRNWLGRPYATEATILRGTGRFFKTFADGEIQWERWEQKLVDLGPHVVLGRANDISGHNPRGTAVAQVLTEIHNDAVKKADKLDPRLVQPRKSPPKPFGEIVRS